MSARVLTIRLNVQEGGLLLEALAELPFKSVFELIGKLNQQAHELFAPGCAQHERQRFVLTESELALTIKALGNLPYHRVHELLADLNRQIQAQVNNSHSSAASQEYAGI
ncbi:MAG: hypothetical protein JSR51_03910 [Proteobacteria bacterium]|jgi:hypothetical protein|nr:hypothetical protein [Pseudomonadota bacterium]